MCFAFERKIAFRFLRARREEGLISVIAFFSLIGIALGVATLIVVLSVMRGVREEMVASILGLEGHVTVYSTSRGVTDYDTFAANLAKQPGVKSAIPVVQGQVMMNYRGQAQGAMASGIRAQDMEYKPLLLQKISQGDIEQFKAGNGIIIGQRMAEKMNIHLGDTITLISPEGRTTPAGMVPRIKAYPVVAMFSIGMFAYDNGLVVLPFDEAQRFFKLSDEWRGGIDENSAETTENAELAVPVMPVGAAGLGKASAVEVMLDDAESAPSKAKELASVLGPNYRLYDWKTNNSHIFQAVIVQRNVFMLVVMLIIMVASFNIVSSLIMLVREKTRDIAILRTMGATRGMILKIFLFSGASVGVIGTALGVGLGLLIALNTEKIQAWLEALTGQKLFADELYFLSHLPSKVDNTEVIVVAAIALGLTFLSALYPARKAAKLDPAEALRYE